jgi:polyhydroxybutyrate depolymerase
MKSLSGDPRRRRRAGALAACLLAQLAGCAAGGNYPRDDGRPGAPAADGRGPAPATDVHTPATDAPTATTATDAPTATAATDAPTATAATDARAPAALDVAANAEAAVPSARASAGCSRPAPAPGATARTLAVDGRPRTYLLSIPEGARPGTPLPLVFAWHGLGGSGRLARAYFGVEQAARGGAIFVYPDALPLPAFMDRTGWDLDPAGGDLRFFDALYAEVTGAACVDLGHVYSTGHSFGGFMSHHLGCQRRALFRALGVVAGGLPPGTCPGADLPVWIAHAMNDPTVPFAAGEAGKDHWTMANGCSGTAHAVEPAPCTAFEGCHPGAAVHFCVHQQRHAWPPFAGAGIWGFFAALR